jgi:hypothetical protein
MGVALAAAIVVNQFCTRCGVGLVYVPSGRFSSATGAPVLVGKCPSGICGHDGIAHTWRRRFFASDKCTRCGAVAVYVD